MFPSIAETDVASLLRPREVGERVNSNVIRAVLEPRPDYEAMARIADPRGAEQAKTDKA